jgi:hypothetical protein
LPIWIPIFVLEPEKIKSSDKKIYKKWIKLVGGSENVFLRDFLKNLRLA